MGSAAKLHGKISHLNHPDLFAVLLTEKSHGSGLSRILKRHDAGLNGKRMSYLLVDYGFNLFKLLIGHCGKVGKVKPQSLTVYKGTRLLHMAPQNLS